VQFHQVILRATDERATERFATFDSFCRALGEPAVHKPLPLSAPWSSFWAGLLAKIPRREAPSLPASTARSGPPGLTPTQAADYKALANLAVTASTQKNYPLVVEVVRTLWSTYPASRATAAYSLLLAEAFLKTGHTKQAREELLKPIHIEPTVGSITLRTELWRQLDGLTEAENQLSQIIDQFTPTTLHFMARARLRCELNDYEGAWQDRPAARSMPGAQCDYPPAVDAIWETYMEEFPGLRDYVEEISSRAP
jgi:hypothetical protein